MTDLSEKTPAEKIREVIEEQSQRQTRAKSQIAERLAELSDQNVDFTVEELWHDLQKESPHIGRATVFRTVELLVNQGLLNRINFTDGSHTYRACGNYHHHHLTCMRCHRVVDIDVCIPGEQIDKISRQTHFLIKGHSLTLFGICAECQKTPS